MVEINIMVFFFFFFFLQRKLRFAQILYDNFSHLGKALASSAKFAFVYKTEYILQSLTDNCSCLNISKKLSLSFKRSYRNRALNAS